MMSPVMTTLALVLVAMKIVWLKQDVSSRNNNNDVSSNEAGSIAILAPK